MNVTMSFSAFFEEAYYRVQFYRDAPMSTFDNVLQHHTDPSVATVLWDKAFGTGREIDEMILALSESLKHEIFEGNLYAVVPLYVTSICSERCLYCNFRASNQSIEIERVRLTDDELEYEVKYLIEQKGFRVIELVYATDPLIRVERMCRDIERVQRLLEKSGGGAVGINAEALDEQDYRHLKNAGLNFIVLWQETYNKDRYSQLHPGFTKKSRFEYRLDAYDRMVSAGIDAFGMGVLSGLSDWRLDWALLMEHEAYLARTYGKSPAILGIPRLKPAAGSAIQQTTTTPSRQELKSLIALHNIFAPYTLPFLNSREEWELCLEMARGGGNLFTFNCSTIPGGYTAGTKGYQFPTESYDAPVFAPLLTRRGLKPLFNWHFKGRQPYTTEKRSTVTLIPEG